MTRTEAKKLAELLGLTLVTRRPADELFDLCAGRGWTLAVEHDNGDWVVLSSANVVIARVA